MTIGPISSMMTIGPISSMMTIGPISNIMTIGQISNIMTIGQISSIMTIGQISNIMTIGQLCLDTFYSVIGMSLADLRCSGSCDMVVPLLSCLTVCDVNTGPGKPGLFCETNVSNVKFCALKQMFFHILTSSQTIIIYICIICKINILKYMGYFGNLVLMLVPGKWHVYKHYYFPEKRKFSGILCIRQKRCRRRVTILLSAR